MLMVDTGSVLNVRRLLNDERCIVSRYKIKDNLFYVATLTLPFTYGVTGELHCKVKVWPAS